MKTISIVFELARALAGQPDLRELRTDYVQCGGGAAASTIEAVFDDGRRLLCASSRESAPLRCVERTSPGEEAPGLSACAADFGKQATPAPAWIAPFGQREEGTFDIYAPRKPGVPTVIVRDGEERLYVGLRANSGWRMMDEPLGEGTFWGDVRALDASALTHAPSFGLVVGIYNGGSQSGIARTELVILAEEDGKLRKKDARLVGLFEWALSPQERSRCKGCATSYDARPHVEVRLEPTVTAAGLLRLTAKRTELKRLRHVCEAHEVARGRSDDDSICSIEEIREVQGNAGAWRYADGHLVR